MYAFQRENLIPRCCKVDCEILGTPFATILHYSQLCDIIRTIRDFALFVLFPTRYSDYSLFAICDYSIFAIRVFQTPQLSSSPLLVDTWSISVKSISCKPNDIMTTPLKVRVSIGKSVVLRVRVTNKIKVSYESMIVWITIWNIIIQKLWKVTILWKQNNCLLRRRHPLGH